MNNSETVKPFLYKNTLFLFTFFMQDALIIFVRKPELGKVKTRLAAQIGNEAALNIYKKLLSCTRQICQPISADKYLFGAETEKDICWQGFYNYQQFGKDLGDRMHLAFETLFKKNYKKILIIGSDCPSLTTEIIEHAFESLSKNDIVIGPARDGGYYLLGMKKLWPDIFLNKKWSTALVFEDTLKSIENLKLNYKMLPVLRDVDEAVDVPPDWSTV